MPEARVQELAEQLLEMHMISLNGTVAESKAAETQSKAICRIAEKEGIQSQVKYAWWNGLMEVKA